LEDSRAQKGLNDLDKKTNQTTNSFGGLSKAVKSFAGAAVVGLAVKQITKFGMESAKAFSDLDESMNATKVVFGDSVDIIRQFGKESVSQAGLAEASFNQMAAVLGSTLKNSGLAMDDVAERTVDLTKRAADLASVFNTDVDEAMVAIGAAIRGESEPIRRFGVTLSDAAVSAKALEAGLVDSKNEITDQVKIQARYLLLMEQSDQVAGDFVNTQGSLANQMKLASENTTELKAAIGESLAPAMASLLENGLNPLVSGFASLVSNANDSARAISLVRQETDKATKSTLAQSVATAQQDLETISAGIKATQALLDKNDNERDPRYKREKRRLEELQAAYLQREQQLTSMKRTLLEQQNAEKDYSVALVESSTSQEKNTESSEKAVEVADKVLTMEERLLEGRRINNEALAQAGIVIQDVDDARYRSAELNNQLEESMTRKTEEETRARMELKRKELSSVAGFFGGFSDLLAVAGKENEKAFKVSKGLAMAESGINSYLAFTKTLADGGPFPFNTIAAAGVLASGLAQQARIANTPAPTAQTGTPEGGYTVPDNGSQSADTVAVMASPGETVNVTPRGETTGRSISISIDRDVIFKVMNEGIESGDIKITNNNIQQGIAL
jgi:hypothetical protein